MEDNLPKKIGNAILKTACAGTLLGTSYVHFHTEQAARASADPSLQLASFTCRADCAQGSQATTCQDGETCDAWCSQTGYPHATCSGGTAAAESHEPWTSAAVTTPLGFSFGIHVYELCCPSGDCDTTVCVNEGAHVECGGDGKANAVCDSF